MSTATLENPVDNLDNAAHQFEQDFRDVAMRVAGGESLTPEAITAVCIPIGKSFAQFQSLVRVLRQRSEALATIAAADARREAVNAKYAVVKEVAEKLKQLDATYRKQRKELSDDYVRADAAYQAASSAESWEQQRAHNVLRQTCGDPTDNYRDPRNVKVD